MKKILTPPPAPVQGARGNFRPPYRQIGCAFAPLPLVALHAIKAKVIGDRAATLLAFLLNRRQPGAWAWASNAFLARELGCSVDTIIRAAKQLAAAGLVTKHQVPAPDPDDRANRTGWRWRFLFLGSDVRPPQACARQTEATIPSVAPSRPSVHAPVATPRLNQESEQKQDRSIDPPFTEDETETKTDALCVTPGIVDRAIEIAQEAHHDAFAQDLRIDRERIALRVTGQEGAFLAAIRATTSRINGTAKAKPIADPMGYCFRTLADYLKRGIPADPVYRPRTKTTTALAPKPPRVVIPLEEQPSSADIWAWRRRGAPS